MRIIFLSLLLSTQFSAFSQTLTSGYFLKWDSDHTERQIRPVYPISEKDIKSNKAYLVAADQGKPSKVCYFSFGKPSNDADFGAHCIHFSYSNSAITRTFFNTDKKQVNNNEGIYKERYILDGQTYPKVKQHLDTADELVENKSGAAEFYFTRDQQGRSYAEIRRDKHGKVVLEHNGFYQARFAFDKNDYAVYRRGYDQKGQIMEGKYGYATAYFWFDKNGTFLKEEFRDAKDKLVLGPTARYARIEYKDIDPRGNWHKVVFFDENQNLLSKYPAIAIADYDKLFQRTSIRYFNAQKQPAENSYGIFKYVYSYNNDGALLDRKGYSLKNKLVIQ